MGTHVVLKTKFGAVGIPEYRLYGFVVLLSETKGWWKVRSVLS